MSFDLLITLLIILLSILIFNAGFFYKKFFRKTFDFKSASSNEEYWLIMLFYLIFIFFFLVVGDILFRFRFFIFVKLIVNFLYVFLFGSLLPFFSLQIRRIKFLKKNWGIYLINYIPVIVSIYIILIIPKLY